MERRRISLVGPTLLVGVGVILLLNNLGILNWGLWDIARLWPILLIAAGLEILLGHRSVWASIAAAAVVLILIVGGVLLVGRGEPLTGRGGEEVELSYPRDGTSTASIELKPAATSLSVGALVDAPELVVAQLRLRRDERLNEQFVAGDHARLTLASRALGTGSYVGMDRYAGWTVALNPDIALNLSVEIGVGPAELDLTQLSVEEAGVNIGVGQVEVTLPEIGNTTLHVEGGMGTIRINLPAALGVRVITDTALVARDLPADFTRSGDTYTSPNYDRADYRATVTIGLGIGTVTVRQLGSN
jgi:hypothetical protein